MNGLKLRIEEKKHLISKIKLFIRNVNEILILAENIETYDIEKIPDESNNVLTILRKLKSTKPILNEVKEWLK